MTIKTTDTWKFSRKNHPNEKNYLGRATMETMQAFTQALECLEGEEFDKLCDGTLIYDEERTGELFDAILADDIIGLCYNVRGVGWVAEQFKVLSIDKEADKMLCQSRYNKEKEQEFFFEDISIGLLLGRAEILIRDGKPFGLTDDQLNVTVKIVDLSKKEEDTPEVDPNATAQLPGEVTVPAVAETILPNESSDASVALETVAEYADSLMASAVDLETDDDSSFDEEAGYNIPKKLVTQNNLTGTRIWLVYHGIENGSREDCSIFYAEPEAYSTQADAEAREAQLNAANVGNSIFYAHVTLVSFS